jgi:hypothetical protein
VQGSETVVNTADAVLDPQYLLTGYSGYDDGVLKQGTMTNLSGNWQSTTFKGVSGTGILAQIPKGYSDGGTNTYTYCSDANFVASNIVSGKSIFGVTGTYDPVTLIAGTSYILYESNDIVSNTTTTNIVMKSATCNYHGGTVTVSFGQRNYNSTCLGYAQIYVNGLARGILRTLSGDNIVFVTYTENISVNAGDIIQIYGYTNVDGKYNQISNFIISCGNSIAVFS